MTKRMMAGTEEEEEEEEEIEEDHSRSSAPNISANMSFSNIMPMVKTIKSLHRVSRKVETVLVRGLSLSETIVVVVVRMRIK